jgi:glyoxylase I family protein
MPATPAPIQIVTTGVHHLALRCTDLARSRRFYVEMLGFVPLLDTPGLCIVAAGQTAVAIRAPGATTESSDTFDPFRVGLDHVALSCADPAELQRVAAALTGWGVEHTGVKTDEVLGKDYVAFSDPDGIKWELYMQ